MISNVYRFIVYSRFLYSLILVTYYNSIPQDILENDSDLDPVSEVLEEIIGLMIDVNSIFKELIEIRNHRYHLHNYNSVKTVPENSSSIVYIKNSRSNYS